MGKSIGTRHLNEASAMLRRVRGGGTVTVTDRGQRIALIGGRITWSGGKPVGIDRAERVRGPTVADAVIDDRR